MGGDVGLVDPDMAVLEAVSPTARDFDDGKSRGSGFSGHEGNGKPKWARFGGRETKMTLRPKAVPVVANGSCR